MMIRKLLSILSLSVIITLAGCSSKNSDGSSDGGSSPFSGSAACILDFAERLDELLTVELASSYSGHERSDAKFDYSKMMKSSAYHSARYSWKSGRVKEIKMGKQVIEAPAFDKIELGGIKKANEESFRRSVRNPTDEELAEAGKRMKEALSGKSDNEAINKRLEKLKEMGVDPETIVGGGSAITAAAGKVAQAFSEVEGVGDLAAWNARSEQLHVWADGAEFYVSVVVDDNQEVNREKSIALAKEVLKKCR